MEQTRSKIARRAFLLLVLLLVSSCGSSNEPAKPTPEPVSKEPPAPGRVTFPPTLEGQLDRIDAEGGHSMDAVLDNWVTSLDGLKYSMLEKNATKYEGLAFNFYGKILQIQETGESTQARICFADDSNAVFYVEGRFSTPYLKGQLVNTIGYLAGNYRYTSQAGWNLTIPALAARTMFTEKEEKPYKSLYLKRYGSKRLTQPKPPR